MRKATDFSKTYKFGKSYNELEFYIKSLKSNYPNSSFAVVVPKKVSSKAVERNKFRRQVYEIIRTNITNINPGYTIIITIKKNISSISYKDLEKNILKGLKVLGLINNEKNTN